MTSGLTAVTIFYANDIEFLLMQARSFERYVPDDLFAQIILVENYEPANRQALRQRLLAAYGRHAPKVVFYSSNDICPMPAMDGWVSQQVLKMAVCAKVPTDQYLLLDTKNHFIRPVSRDHFFAPDGRPYLHMPNYIGHPLEDFLRRALAFWQLDERYMAEFCQTITPFVMHTSVVAAMLQAVEQRQQGSFAECLMRQQLTEFFTYGAFIVSSYGTLEQHYALRRGVQYQPANVLWSHRNTVPEVAALLEATKASGHPVFAVHRTALRGMPVPACRALAAFWVEHGIFVSMGSAWSFIVRQKARLIAEVAANLAARAQRKAARLWRQHVLARLRPDSGIKKPAG